jgi:hypothetical protein
MRDQLMRDCHLARAAERLSLIGLPIDEMAFQCEVVVDVGVNGGNFL